MNIVYFGIDLAKNVFAVHGVNCNGLAELVRPTVKRAELTPLIAFGTLHYCNGSLLRGPPLGASVCPLGAHRQTNSAQVRYALSDDRQTI